MHRPLTAGVVSGRARLAKSALVAARMGADIQNAVEVGVKEAMKAKDKERLAGLRGIKAMLQASAKDKGVDTLPDEECITVLRKLAKQRQESIDPQVLLRQLGPGIQALAKGINFMGRGQAEVATG